MDLSLLANELAGLEDALRKHTERDQQKAVNRDEIAAQLQSLLAERVTLLTQIDTLKAQLASAANPDIDAQYLALINRLAIVTRGLEALQ